MTSLHDAMAAVLPTVPIRARSATYTTNRPVRVVEATINNAFQRGNVLDLIMMQEKITTAEKLAGASAETLNLLLKYLGL